MRILKFPSPKTDLLPAYRHVSHSSHSWLERQRKDVYKKAARYDNYRARSAYKLIQIDDKYKFLKPGKIVVEAGAAPGSWTQVICERLQLSQRDLNDNNSNQAAKNQTAGLCLAIDIEAIQPVDGAICLGQADFTSPFTQGKILSWLNGRRADCVLSDMAPRASGQKDLDHTRIVQLVNSFISFALKVLKPECGMLLFKLWDGMEREELIARLRRSFNHVKVVKPDASRDDSSELFVICLGYK